MVNNIPKYLQSIWGDVKDDSPITSPFIDYICEDKSKYRPLSETYIKTGRFWVDKDNDFLEGNAGGILMNMDFIFVNTEIFTEVARDYQLSGNSDEDRYYNDNTYMSEPYKEFWRRETIRRREGMTANCKLYFKDIDTYTKADDKDKHKYLHPLHITGDHYNYLNYGRIERTPTPEERIELDKQGLYKQSTIEGFPRFWDGDYWNFKLDSLIAANGKNLCKAKARRKGFSYKRGSQAANTVNMYKKITVTLAAYDKAYLTDRGATTYMTKINLDWYETHTHWVRGYIKEQLDDIILGYKESEGGHKHKGWLSNLYSVGCRGNESAAIGKKAVELDLEEAGKFANIEEVLGVTLSNLEAGSAKIGTIRVYGTAGTKEANWKGFKSIYYNPNKYNMLPMENIWDITARHTICGFFFPQIWCYEPFIDLNGNSRLIDSYYDDLDVKEISKRELTGEKLIVAIGQRANSPEEAFNSSKENIFTSYELDSHIMDLEHNDDYHFYRDGQLVLKNGNIELITNDSIPTHQTHAFITDIGIVKNTDVSGCWREYYSPFLIDGHVNPDDHAIVYDPYGVDKNRKELKLYHSLASIQVWSLPNCKAPYGGDRLLAEFIGRRDTMEEVDRIVWYACRRWNCKVLPEINKGEIVSNFSKWGVKSLIMRDPTTLIEKGYNNKNDGYGISLQNDIDKLNYIRDLYDFIYSPISSTESSSIIYRLSYIYSIGFCKELQSYNLSGNFDRLSSALLYTIYRRAAIRIGRTNDKVDSKENTLNKRIIHLLHGER